MKDFDYSVTIAADTEDIYNALITPFQIELWSGYPADMKEEVGYCFSLWDGDICGVNLEFVKNKKIVQEWFFGENEHRSIVTIEIKKTTESGRSVVKLHHTNIPDEVYDEIVEGWQEYYLGSMKNMLEMY